MLAASVGMRNIRRAFDVYQQSRILVESSRSRGVARGDDDASHDGVDGGRRGDAKLGVENALVLLRGSRDSGIEWDSAEERHAELRAHRFSPALRRGEDLGVYAETLGEVWGVRRQKLPHTRRLVRSRALIYE